MKTRNEIVAKFLEDVKWILDSLDWEKEFVLLAEDYHREMVLRDGYDEAMDE